MEIVSEPDLRYAILLCYNPDLFYASLGHQKKPLTMCGPFKPCCGQSVPATGIWKRYVRVLVLPPATSLSPFPGLPSLRCKRLGRQTWRKIRNTMRDKEFEQCSIHDHCYRSVATPPSSYYTTDQARSVHEICRQVAVLEAGGSVLQETRGFDEEKAETYALRSKEDAPDYRYMPDPNLPPLLLSEVGLTSKTVLSPVVSSFLGICLPRQERVATTAQ